MSYFCSKGHRVNAENSAINFDSLCRICKRQARDAQWRANPFFAGIYDGGPAYDIDAVSRLERVARFNTDQCRRALHVRGLQKTVRTAVERRLRRLGAKA
jgi:hypothetical protein